MFFSNKDHQLEYLNQKISSGSLYDVSFAFDIAGNCLEFTPNFSSKESIDVTFAVVHQVIGYFDIQNYSVVCSEPGKKSMIDDKTEIIKKISFSSYSKNDTDKVDRSLWELIKEDGLFYISRPDSQEFDSKSDVFESFFSSDISSVSAGAQARAMEISGAIIDNVNSRLPSSDNVRVVH